MYLNRHLSSIDPNRRSTKNLNKHISFLKIRAKVLQIFETCKIFIIFFLLSLAHLAKKQYLCTAKQNSPLIHRLNDIDIEVERKFIRSMRLSILTPDARVHLSVPFFVSSEAVQSFLLSRWEWICRNREKVLNRPRPQLPEYVSGEQHYLFGRPYTLQPESVTSGANAVVLEGETIIMRCRPNSTVANRRALLHEWYRPLLRARLTALVGIWLARLGEAPVEWTIRHMRREWGSCAARKRRLVFNLDLARVPDECIEYVVVHELTHLAVQNHGPAFQTLMTQRLPNWKNLRKQLNNSSLWNTRSKQSEC